MKTKTRQNLIHPKLVSLVPSVFYKAHEGEYGEQMDCEPYFSKTPCDCCGTFLAGDRLECQAVINENGTHPLCFDNAYVCTDCVQTWQ